MQKTEFCHATVTFLGHLVGQGQVKPLEAKVNAISEFPVPKCKRQLMRFLGMAGYYRKFCKNFSGIAEPLTNLLKKGTKFKWNDKCQDAFDRLKAILKSAPVLLAPDFDKCFKLALMQVMLVLVLFFYKKIMMVLIIQFVTFLRSLTNIRKITQP